MLQGGSRDVSSVSLCVCVCVCVSSTIQFWCLSHATFHQGGRRKVSTEIALKIGENVSFFKQMTGAQGHAQGTGRVSLEISCAECWLCRLEGPVGPDLRARPQLPAPPVSCVPALTLGKERGGNAVPALGRAGGSKAERSGEFLPLGAWD